MIRLGAGLGGLGFSLLGLGHPHATPLVGWPKPGEAKVVLADRSQGLLLVLDRDLIPKWIWMVPPPTHLAPAQRGMIWVVHSPAGPERHRSLVLVDLRAGQASHSWNLQEAPLDLHTDGRGRGWILGGGPGKFSLRGYEEGNPIPSIHDLPLGVTACWLREGRLLFQVEDSLGWVRLETLGGGLPLRAEGDFPLGQLEVLDLVLAGDGILLLGIEAHTMDRPRRVVQRRLWGEEPSWVQGVGAKAERLVLRGDLAESLEASEAWVVHSRSRQVELLPEPGGTGYMIATGDSGGIQALGDLDGRLLLATSTCLRLFSRDGQLLVTQGGFDQLVALSVI